MGRGTQGGKGRRMLVRLDGYWVEGVIGVPAAHRHAIWLLPLVEAACEGAGLRELVERPPWPVPRDPVLVEQLVQELLDERWVAVDWSSGRLEVRKDLRELHATEGRDGLASLLFGLELFDGRWWMSALGGPLLDLATVQAYDWDFARKYQEHLEGTEDPQVLLDQAPVDLLDLIRKLNGVDMVWSQRDKAVLGTRLRVTERKDILVPLYGHGLRVFDDELAELEPVLEQHAPELLGRRRAGRSRFVRLPGGPLERLAEDLARLPPAWGRVEPRLVQRQVSDLATSLAPGGPVESALEGSVEARVVAGPAAVQFAWLAELCQELGADDDLVMTTSFLNEENLVDGGLAWALGHGARRVRLLYGHANDDTPARQQQDLARYRNRLVELEPSLAGRLEVAATEHRIHTKVVLSSRGDWALGSWNPGSSRPGGSSYELTLAGRDGALAADLAGRIGLEPLGPPLSSPPPDLAQAREALGLLAEAVERPEAWEACLRAARVALLPAAHRFTPVLIDEHQTRDLFLAMARAVRAQLLVSSDRLSDTALDPALLRDLARRRALRLELIWGREWRSTDLPREVRHRARRALRQGRDVLGDRLVSSDGPMENHAKVLLCDGSKGLVGSENLLSYGMEKSAYESHELGLAFACPPLARRIQAHLGFRWVAELELATDPLPWVGGALEAWHGLRPFLEPGELDTAVIQSAIELELQERDLEDCLDRVRHLAGADWLEWALREGERLGLLVASPDGRRVPSETADAESVNGCLDGAREALAQAPHVPLAATVSGTLLGEIMEGMVRIEPGEFRMGDRRVRRESPVHRVRITKPFLMARTVVTQRVWEEVAGRLPPLKDADRDPDFPVVNVSYKDIQGFLKELNSMPGGGRFDLPTEAEWEFCCRAGADSLYCFGDDPGGGRGPGRLEQYAWTKRSRRKGRIGLCAPGQLEPNAWGLYDMHGLVYETMKDGRRRFTPDPVDDPAGPDQDPRVARGGGWGRNPVDRRNPEQEHFRCASRQRAEASRRVGFRLVWRLE